MFCLYESAVLITLVFIRKNKRNQKRNTTYIIHTPTLTRKRRKMKLIVKHKFLVYNTENYKRTKLWKNIKKKFNVHS